MNQFLTSAYFVLAIVALFLKEWELVVACIACSNAHGAHARLDAAERKPNAKV